MLRRGTLARVLTILTIVGIMLLLGLTKVQPAAGAGTTLTIALPAARPETAFIKQNLGAFTQSTGITVKVIEIPYENLHTKLATEFVGGGHAYDVVGMPYEWIPSFAQFFQPVDNQLTSADRKDFLKAAIKATNYKGHIYGSLYTITSQVLFYRTDLFHKYHLSVPTTWTQYLSDAKRLTQPPRYGTIVTAANNPEPVGMFLDYLYEAGGNIADSKGRVTINSPAAVKALTFMMDQVYRYKVAPPGAANYTTADTTTLFTEGKLGMAPNWVYMYAIAGGKDSKVRGKFGVAPLPKGVKRGASIGAWVLSVVKTSSNQAAAYKLVNFMTDTKRQGVMATAYGNVPTRYSSAQLPQVRKLGFVKPTLDTLAHGVPRLKTPAWPDIETTLAQTISAALSRQMTPKAALDRAASSISAAMAKAGH